MKGEHNGMVMFIYIASFIDEIEIIKINNELGKVRISGEILLG